MVFARGLCFLEERCVPHNRRKGSKMTKTANTRVLAHKLAKPPMRELSHAEEDLVSGACGASQTQSVVISPGANDMEVESYDCF